jgi:hypothetical protein
MDDGENAGESRLRNLGADDWLRGPLSPRFCPSRVVADDGESAVNLSVAVSDSSAPIILFLGSKMQCFLPQDKYRFNSIGN